MKTNSSWFGWNSLTAAAVVGVGMTLLSRRLRRIDLHGASVVISGGSRGLGLELAREFARKGAALTLLARDEPELSRARDELLASDADVLIVPCNVSDREQCVRAMRIVRDVRKRIDVLVNVAGIIQVGPLENLEDADFESAMGVHFWGPYHLSMEAISTMKALGGGRIVNISSIAGLVATPHLLPYDASKFALTGFSTGLRTELARHRIYVTTVCPGLMRTGSHVNAEFKGRHDDEFTWFSLGSGLPIFSVNARRAARKIVEACRTARPMLIISPQARLLHLANAIFPNTVARLMSSVARLLPAPGDGSKRRLGWESRSSIAPSILTWPADRNIARNNELPAGIAAEYFSGKRGNGKAH